MVTDINGIPSALIKRVEIISGGASATYGADAIGGVTNFILRDDFEGLEVDLQRGMTEAGDGDESRAYAIMGTKVGDGKGNITFGAEYYRRDAAYERNRDFFRNSWSDPNVASNDLFVFGYNGYNSGFTPPNAAALARCSRSVGPTRSVRTGIRAYARTPTTCSRACDSTRTAPCSRSSATSAPATTRASSTASTTRCRTRTTQRRRRPGCRSTR